MLDRTLGPEYLRELKSILDEDGAFDWLAFGVCEIVPTSEVPSKKGKVPYVPAAMMMGSEDLPDEIGFTDATHEVDFELSDRDYDTRRIGIKVPVSVKQVENDELYAQAKDKLMPSISNKVGYTIDARHLGEILRGDGLAADSRDVTVESIAVGEKWDTADGEPLDKLEAAHEAIGGGSDCRLILSGNIASVLQKNEQVARSYHGQGTGRLSKSALAEHLEDYLGIDEVVIDRKVYQNGLVTDTFTSASTIKDVCCITKKANLAIVPFGGESIDFREELKKDENIYDLIGDIHLDVVTYDPAHTVAFKDVETE